MKLAKWCALWGVLLISLAAVSVRAQTAETEKAVSLPAYHCDEVLDVKMVHVNELGRVRLIGIAGVNPGEPGYEKAIAAVKKYCLNKEIHFEKCDQELRTPDGAIRGVVYYEEGGQWYNLNTKLLRAGLASAVVEPQCQVDTSSWAQLVEEAKKDHHGLYYLGIALPVTSTKASVPPPVPEKEQNRLKGIDLFHYNDATPVPINAKYVGNVVTKRFHRLDCILRPKDERNRCYFTDRETAFRLGFKPCYVCKP